MSKAKRSEVSWQWMDGLNTFKKLVQMKSQIQNEKERHYSLCRSCRNKYDGGKFETLVNLVELEVSELLFKYFYL